LEKKHDLIPVKLNQIINLYIQEKGKKDDGIGIINKYVIIVPATIKGEEYMVQITKVMPTYAFAKKIKNKNDKEVN